MRQVATLSCEQFGGNDLRVHLSVNGRSESVIEQVADPEMVFRGRVQGQGCPVAPDEDRLIDAPDSPLRRLQDRTGVAQDIDEAPCRAVQTGRFRSIQLDQAIVDAQTGQGCQNVFDKPHVFRGTSQRCSPLCAGHIFELGMDADVRLQIGAHENDPGIRRGRMKVQAYIGSCQVAHAADVCAACQGSLIAIAVSSHVIVILDCYSESLFESLLRGCEGAVYCTLR